MICWQTTEHLMGGRERIDPTSREELCWRKMAVELSGQWQQLERLHGGGDEIGFGDATAYGGSANCQVGEQEDGVGVQMTTGLCCVVCMTCRTYLSEALFEHCLASSMPPSLEACSGVPDRNQAEPDLRGMPLFPFFVSDTQWALRGHRCSCSKQRLTVPRCGEGYTLSATN